MYTSYTNDAQSLHILYAPIVCYCYWLFTANFRPTLAAICFYRAQVSFSIYDTFPLNRIEQQPQKKCCTQPHSPPWKNTNTKWLLSKMLFTYNQGTHTDLLDRIANSMSYSSLSTIMKWKRLTISLIKIT